MSVVPFAWGRLEVLEKIGEGTFGEVYRAHDELLERDVALKLRRTDAPSGSNILDEARHFASVKHPNVLSIFGVDRCDGRAGFWTELVDGKTLETVVKESGPFGAREAALIGVDLCHALAAVHGAGLVHGDVKPSNVMRERGGRVVLMDFGTASRRDEDQRGAGTPLTMAPELLRGEAATPAVDLYATGALLYFLTTANYPTDVVVPLADRRPELPAAFVRAVEHALAPNALDRPSSAGAMAQALGDYLDPRPARIGKKPLFAAVFVLALIALFALFTLRAPAPLAKAVLFRSADSGAEALAPGARVEPGDRLHLELEHDRSLYVYVLNEDDRGAVYLLFPLAGLDHQNPIPAGRQRLPGSLAGRRFDWQVTSSGGRERFLLAAAESALPQLESVIQGLDAAVPGRPVELAATLRGVGGLAPNTSTRRELDQLAESLAASGVHVTRFELENQAP